MGWQDAPVVGETPATAPKPKWSDAPLADTAGDKPSFLGHTENPGDMIGDAVKGSPVYGAADIAGSGMMNLLGKIAAGYHGMMQLATGQGLDSAADTVNSDRETMHTEATSPGAKKVQGALGVVSKPFEAVAAPIDKAVNNLPNGAQTAIHGVEEAVPDIAAVLPFGGAARAAKAADAASVVEGAAKPSVADGAGTVRAAGYKMMPSDVEARMGPKPTLVQSAVESAGGQAARRDMQLHNAAKTNELAAQDMRIAPKPKITPDDFDSAREPHYQTYTDTGNMADLSKPSAKVQQALQDIVADDTMQGRVQPQIRNAINQIQARMAAGNYTGAQAIKDISTFRKKGVPQVAAALEDEIGDQLASSGRADSAAQLAKFQDARTQLAKIKNYQDASTGGVVDAADFKRLSENSPHLLTGNAKIIAQAGSELPGLTSLPKAAKPATAVDRVLGLVKGGLVVPKAAEVVAGKIAQSKGFQGNFGREMSPTEASYVPSYGRKAEPPSEALSLQPPPGSAGVDPTQLGMQLAQGRPAAPRMDLAPPEGNVGVNPVQLGMQVAQGRPLDEQQLMLKPTEGPMEPYQPSLLGHPGTPEGGGRSKPKAKKRGKD